MAEEKIVKVFSKKKHKKLINKTARELLEGYNPASERVPATALELGVVVLRDALLGLQEDDTGMKNSGVILGLHPGWYEEAMRHLTIPPDEDKHLRQMQLNGRQAEIDLLNAKATRLEAENQVLRQMIVPQTPPVEALPPVTFCVLVWENEQNSVDGQPHDHIVGPFKDYESAEEFGDKMLPDKWIYEVNGMFPEFTA